MKAKKIGIVSLSSGILGEAFIEHELNIGNKRLREYGLEVVYLPNATKGIEYLKENPFARAKDLLAAFSDDSIDFILCAIGGDDTYKLLPFLFENKELEKAVYQKPFIGFSDTTINHFMLNKVGIKTFYGQAFIPDICELADEMLAYTKSYFEELIDTGKIKKIQPSKTWYLEREDFSENALGTQTKSFENKGFELIRGASCFQGEILGGCLESIYDMFDDTRYSDSPTLCKKYEIFPSLEEWSHKILLLETSEEKPTPDLFRKMIRTLADFGLFNVVRGVLFGKPQDEKYYEEYKSILLEEISNKNLPILYNINIGHARPRCIIPFGVEAIVDAKLQMINFED